METSPKPDIKLQDYEQIEGTDVLVIGNGPPACGVALHLKAQGVQFSVVGPGKPMSNWQRVTEGQDMGHFRSPVHHFISDPRRNTETPSSSPDLRSTDITPDSRMKLAVLDAFHLKLIKTAGIHAHARDGWVDLVGVQDDGTFDVFWHDPSGARNRQTAQSVVMSPGIGRPFIPDIPGVKDPRVSHSDALDLKNSSWRNQRVLVVGAGQSGFTIADGLQKRGANVVLTSRSEPYVHPLDFHPGYFRGGQLEQFRAKSIAARTDELKTAHRRGRVHPYVYEQVMLAKNVQLRENTPVEELISHESDIEAPGIGHFNRIVFCTGYRMDFAGLPWASQIVEGSKLSGGLPAVSPANLQIEGLPNAYAIGRLGSLGAGPASSNYGMIDENARLVAFNIVRKGILAQLKGKLTAML
jgi:hypothetical protein